MRALLLCLLTLSLSLPASAERLQRFGELEVHYSVFNSTFLQPDIAAASGLERSKQRGVINIALRKGSQAQAGTVCAACFLACKRRSNCALLSLRSAGGKAVAAISPRLRW